MVVHFGFVETHHWWECDDAMRSPPKNLYSSSSMDRPEAGPRPRDFFSARSRGTWDGPMCGLGWYRHSDMVTYSTSPDRLASYQSLMRGAMRMCSELHRSLPTTQ